MVALSHIVLCGLKKRKDFTYFPYIFMLHSEPLTDPRTFIEVTI